MKGSSASMGTDRLTATCSSLGSLSDAELRLQAPALLRTLSEELGAAQLAARALPAGKAQVGGLVSRR